MSESLLALIVSTELEEAAREVAGASGCEAMSLIPARGVSSRELPGFFGITAEGRQSIMLYLLETERGLELLRRFASELRLGEHAHGVACCIAIEQRSGQGLPPVTGPRRAGQEAVMLVVFVAAELEDKAMTRARELGARGLTLVDGRGLEFPEHLIFGRQVYRGSMRALLTIVAPELAESIAERLNREFQLEQRFKGLAFSLPLQGAEGVDVPGMRGYLKQHPDPD